MSETAAVALLSVAATLFLGSFTRLRWSTMAALAPFVGLGVFVLVGSVAVIFAGYAVPVVVVGVTAATLIALAIGRRRRPDRRTLAAVVLSLLGVAAVAALVLTTAPTRLTPDSLQYLTIADMLAEPGGLDAIPATMLIKRALSTSLLHTLGSLDGAPYAAVAGPVLVVSGVAAMVAVIGTTLGERGVARGRILTVVAVALAFTASTNRGPYSAFYVNSHGLMMAAFMVVVGGAFLAGAERGWLLPVAVAAAVMVPARPEGILVAALGLLVVITDDELRPVERVMVALPTALTSLLWFGLGLWGRMNEPPSLDPRDPVFGGIGIGIGLVALAAAVARPPLATIRRWIPWAAPVAMAALLVVDYVADRDILVEAVAATAQNIVGEGMWGVTWIVLGALILGVMFSDGFAGDRAFAAPLVGFGVLFFLLVYLREGTYRVGTGDSGNRILIHGLLVAVTYVVVGAGSPSEPASDPPLSDRPERPATAP